MMKQSLILSTFLLIVGCTPTLNESAARKALNEYFSSTQFIEGRIECSELIKNNGIEMIKDGVQYYKLNVKVTLTYPNGAWVGNGQAFFTQPLNIIPNGSTQNLLKMYPNAVLECDGDLLYLLTDNGWQLEEYSWHRIDVIENQIKGLDLLIGTWFQEGVDYQEDWTATAITITSRNYRYFFQESGGDPGPVQEMVIHSEEQLLVPASQAHGSKDHSIIVKILEDGRMEKTYFHRNEWKTALYSKG